MSRRTWPQKNSSRTSSRSSSPRSPYRSRLIHYRTLLTEACKTLDQYYPELMPRRLRVWWTAQKLTARRAASNDSASIARLMDEMKGLSEADSDD
jgi:hypothetical protein